MLGLIAGILCAIYTYFSYGNELVSLYTLFTGVSLALAFYVITYYVVKLKFFAKIESQSKLMTQGIGIYFFAWIVSWTLILTMLLPSVTTGIYASGELVEGQQLWVVAYNIEGNPAQNVTTSTGMLKMSLIPPGEYTFQLGGNLTGYVVLNQNESLRMGWLESANLEFNLNSTIDPD